MPQTTVPSGMRSPEDREFRRLELGQDEGGHRHYLHGRPVPLGAVLELQQVQRRVDESKSWLEPVAGAVRVTYQASLSEPVAEDVRVTLSGTVGGHPVSFDQEDAMRFRWPPRETEAP